MVKVAVAVSIKDQPTQDWELLGFEHVCLCYAAGLCVCSNPYREESPDDRL